MPTLPSAELDTLSMNRMSTLPSELAIIGLAQDVANELLHGGFTDLFIKFFTIMFLVWLVCLPLMTSACILRDTFRNNTQVFPKFIDSFFEICLHPINSNLTPYFPTSSPLTSYAGTSNETPLDENELSLPAIPITFWFQLPRISCFDKEYLFSFAV